MAPSNDTLEVPGDATIVRIAHDVAVGRERAIAALYEETFDAVFAAARSASARDEAFCLDVVQEVFLRVLRAPNNLARIRDAAHLSRWLSAATRSVTLDLLRAERRRARREETSALRHQSAPPELDARINALQSELERLSPEDQEMIQLRSRGMTMAAVAEAVGATVGAVHGRLRRATQRMGERMRGDS